MNMSPVEQEFGDIIIKQEDDGFCSVHLSIEEGGWTKQRYRQVLSDGRAIIRTLKYMLLAEVPESAPRGHVSFLLHFGFEYQHSTEHSVTGELVDIYVLNNTQGASRHD